MKCYVPVGTLEWKWLKSALQKEREGNVQYESQSVFIYK